MRSKVQVDKASGRKPLEMFSTFPLVVIFCSSRFPGVEFCHPRAKIWASFDLNGGGARDQRGRRWGDSPFSGKNNQFEKCGSKSLFVQASIRGSDCVGA